MFMWMWAAAAADDSLIPGLGPPPLGPTVCASWQTEIRLRKDEWEPSECAQVSGQYEKICPSHSDLTEFPMFCTAVGFCLSVWIKRRSIFFICANTTDSRHRHCVCFGAFNATNYNGMPHVEPFSRHNPGGWGVPNNYLGKGRKQVSGCAGVERGDEMSWKEGWPRFKRSWVIEVFGQHEQQRSEGAG